MVMHLFKDSHIIEINSLGYQGTNRRGRHKTTQKATERVARTDVKRKTLGVLIIVCINVAITRGCVQRADLVFELFYAADGFRTQLEPLLYNQSFRNDLMKILYTIKDLYICMYMV